MSGKNQDKDSPSEDLSGLAGDLLTDIAAEPVPPHLIALAKQLQAALDFKTDKSFGDKDTSDLG